MKKLSSKHLIPIIAGVTALITTLTITLSLTMCDYEEPDLSKYGIGDNGEVAENRLPYGMYDYSKRAFLSTWAPIVYKSDVYFTDGLVKRIPLDSLDCDLLTATEETHHLPEAYSVCPDSTHKHDGKDYEIAKECPGHSGDTLFLIDA